MKNHRKRIGSIFYFIVFVLVFATISRAASLAQTTLPISPNTMAWLNFFKPLISSLLTAFSADALNYAQRHDKTQPWDWSQTTAKMLAGLATGLLACLGLSAI